MILSFAVLYHLLAIGVLPNSNSVMGRRLSPLFVNYANLLGLNTTWQFFSPGPAPTFYLEYEIDEREGHGAIPETKVFPPERRSFSLSDRYKRRLYTLRFFATHPERFRNTFAPWLCRQHPEAESITTQTIIEKIPRLEKIELAGSFGQMAERTGVESETFDCTERSLDHEVLE